MMRDPFLRGQDQAVIGRRSVAEVRALGGEGRVRSRRQVEEAGMRRVSNRLWEVCIRLTEEPVPEHTLVANAEYPGRPELARDGHRGLADFGVLDRRRNRADAPELSDWMEQRELRGAWRVRVHLVQNSLSDWRPVAP